MAKDEPHYMWSLRDPERYTRDFLASRDLPDEGIGGRPPWTVGKTVIVILCVLPVVGYIMVGVWVEALREDMRGGCRSQYAVGSLELSDCLDSANRWP